MNITDLTNKLSIVKAKKVELMAKNVPVSVQLTYMDLANSAEEIYNNIFGMLLINIIYRNSTDSVRNDIAMDFIKAYIERFDEIVESCLALHEES